MCSMRETTFQARSTEPSEMREKEEGKGESEHTERDTVGKKRDGEERTGEERKGKQQRVSKDIAVRDNAQF